MNPLQQSNIELLGRIGLADTARKINEIVRELNIKTLGEKEPKEDGDDDIAHKIWDADNTYEAKKILKDYLKKK